MIFKNSLLFIQCN